MMGKKVEKSGTKRALDLIEFELYIIRFNEKLFKSNLQKLF